MAMIKFKAPPLPVPPGQYDKAYFEQLLRVVNLYFLQLNSLTPVQSEYFKGGGQELVIPHIAASDSTDQYATASNTPTVVRWDTLDSSSGWTLSPPGSATALFAGVYRITYSLQLVNTNNDAHYATVWLRKNGVDVPNSATVFFVPARKSASDFGFTAAYSEVTFAVDAGDAVTLHWATDQAATTGGVTGIYIFHDVAQTTPYARPAVPSAIGSIQFLSALS